MPNPKQKLEIFLDEIKRAQHQPCSVAIRVVIWDQWRGSGVTRGRNPPCFWRQEFDRRKIGVASPGNYIAQWL